MNNSLVVFPSGQNIFFTADTHFGDVQVLKFSARPFASVAEMDQYLIKRWNETVPEDGIVFHLGDISSYGAEKTKAILDQLHGKIYLILGNHDINRIHNSFIDRFEAIEQQMFIQVEDRKIWLNHYPFLAYGGYYKSYWQLFGHIHSGEDSFTGQDLMRLKYLLDRQYDVGADNNKLAPVSFAKVKRKILAAIERSSGNVNMRLREGIMQMNPQMVKSAIKDGANVNNIDWNACTAITNAVNVTLKRLKTGDNKTDIAKCRDIFRTLLQAGSLPCINKKDKATYLRSLSDRINNCKRSARLTNDEHRFLNEVQAVMKFLNT